MMVLASLKNDVRKMSAEITSQIWIVLLIGWKFASSTQKQYLDRVSDTSLVGVSALIFQTSFHGETTGGITKCLLSSQATLSFLTTNLYMYNEVFLY